jgi:large subunit ribosomal protein L21
MYAVVKTGGKQYTVRENDVIQVEKLEVPAGEEFTLGEVLFVSGDKGAQIGSPIVEGAKITGKVVRHSRGVKIIGFTYKKGNQHRRFGHRQPFTQVLIQKINY